MTAEPKPHRRWYQISLRMLLLLVTMASAGFGWLGVKVRKAQRQNEAVEAIRSQGGAVHYDYDSKGQFIESASPPIPGWLRKWVVDGIQAETSSFKLYTRHVYYR